MILDITRHKFSEALLTLLFFVGVAVVAVAARYYEPAVDVDACSAPIGHLLCSFRSSHPVWSIVLFAVIYVYAVLRLSRATVRVDLYSQSTLAAISLSAATLFGSVVSSNYPLLIVVALLIAEAFGRLLYCFGPSVRAHYLFTAMLAFGAMPLVDSALIPLSVVIPIAVILLRLTFRETALTLLGSVLPTFIYCYAMWLAHGSFYDSFLSIWNVYPVVLPDLESYLTPARLVFVGIVVFLQLAIMLIYLTSRVTVTRPTRDMWRVLMISMVVLIASVAISGALIHSLVVAIVLLVAVMLPLLLERANSIQALLIYLLLVLASLAVVI